MGRDNTSIPHYPYRDLPADLVLQRSRMTEVASALLEVRQCSSVMLVNVDQDRLAVEAEVDGYLVSFQMFMERGHLPCVEWSVFLMVDPFNTPSISSGAVEVQDTYQVVQDVLAHVPRRTGEDDR